MPVAPVQTGTGTRASRCGFDAEYAARTTATPAPSIAQTCARLSVSPSGFYEWRGLPASATAVHRGDLADLVARSFTASGTYGYRRVHADLCAWGRPLGPDDQYRTRPGPDHPTRPL